MGTYTDLDVPIDTNGLPDHVPVKTPLLLNIGSLKIGKKEFILTNNDCVAIVDKEAAKEQIEQLHAGLISKLTHYSSDYIEKTEASLD